MNYHITALLSILIGAFAIWHRYAYPTLGDDIRLQNFGRKYGGIALIILGAMILIQGHK